MVYASQVYTLDTMPDPMPGRIREAVGLFATSAELQDAIRHLEGTSFPRHDISVMGNEVELRKVFGTSSPSSDMAADSALTPRTAPSRPEEQTIGTAAAIGGGTYIGAILSKLMGDRYTHHIEEQIRSGGILLWVQTPDKDREDLACSIMQAHGGKHIHVHDIG